MVSRGSRSSRRSSSGALALKLGGVCALAGVVASIVVVVMLVRTLSPAISTQHDDLVSRGWLIGLVMAVICGLVVGLVAYLQGAGVASRLTELGLGLAKIGRGSSEVRFRVSGSDEITRLGRGLQYLASDLAAMASEAEQGGSVGASMDPQVRAFRDLALPAELIEVEGFELDGVLCAGTRGAMEYFDCVAPEGGEAVLFLVANEGGGTLSALATRMARDEVARALRAGANARKALYHANRTLNKQLPKGVCAKLCALAMGTDEVKLYQAGFRPPLLVCRAGKVEEVNAEGLALGLDDGPVFEKGLRSVAVPVSQGTRLVIGNEASSRLDGFAALVSQHAPKHTAPFMNMVLGALEGDAGEGGLREDVVLLTAKRW